MSRKILIIDDNDIFNDMLSCFLGTMGYEVEVATSAKQGLLKLKQAPMDLVVVDIIMPDMDGYDFLRELKKLDCHAKIIAVSGGGFLDKYEYLRTAKLLGADCAFSKPFNSLMAFGSKVEELLLVA